MVTNAHVVRKLMGNLPFAQECINKSLINFGALAEYLKPEIEKELGKEVKLLAISMALRRFSGEKNKVILPEIDPQTDLTTKSNMIEYIYFKSTALLPKINKLSNRVDMQKGDFLSINQGTTKVAVLCNARYESYIDRLLGKESVASKIKNLGILFMSIPSKYRKYQGFFFLLTRELSFNNISIMSIFNIDTEVVFVFNEKDTSRAHQVLLDLIPR